MSETSNNNGLFQKMKNTRISRATLLTAVLLVMALAVIVTVTVVSNRAKQKTEQPDTQNKPSTQTPEEVPQETPEDKPALPEEPQETPDKETGSTVVENKLPSFLLPVNGSLAKKHDPTVQVYSNTMKDYRTHLGVDLLTSENAPVYAAADGTVSKIWKDEWMGYSIAVKHSGDSYTVYRNLSQTLPDGIKEGSSVRAGQLIASVGDSASVELADEPHLHFEMTVNDLAVDPLKYFSEEALKSLSIDASYGE